MAQFIPEGISIPGFGPIPRIVFGAGRVDSIPAHIASFGSCALIVTGRRSFTQSEHWPRLEGVLAERGIRRLHCSINDEPTPGQIDDAVAEYRSENVDVVVGIGGGSALDAAKAIAGLLPFGNSVMDHLEGVGRGIPYTGPATPFLAVPTTAGTGSEATRNAVLTERGGDGFKKSFRHESLVAHTAIVDPELLSGCPYSIMAAQGMDAFTQLLEAFVSRKATPITDALAWSGMEAFVQGFFPALAGGDASMAGRSKLAYASLMSGIALAHAGLGSVHGLASSLGAYFPIPHGVVCGTLLAEAVDLNMALLKMQSPDGAALEKYARVGALIGGDAGMDSADAHRTLVARLREWTVDLGLENLGHYGVKEDDVPRILAAKGTGNIDSNPAQLCDDDLADLIRRRM